MARGLAYQMEPDPSWGRQLVGADAAHLAHFDVFVKKMVKKYRIIALVGVAFFLAGYGAGGWGPTLGTGRRALSLGGVVMGLGLLALAGGLWIPWRVSFAAHRMWGIYERGVVAPLYIKGGLVALVPWEKISHVKHRRMRGAADDPQAEVFLFRFDEMNKYAPIHRIWESVLQQWFGYKPAESIKFREQILAAIRQFLTPEQVVVETEFGAP